MASAQVLRKQEHLEAGKRKLEEFRRKKAAEKAKKATSTSLPHAPDGASHEKQPSETERVRLTDSDGLGTSGDLADGHFGKSKTDESNFADKSDFSFPSSSYAKPSVLESNNYINSSVREHSYLNNEEYKRDHGSNEFRSSSNMYHYNRKDDDASSDSVASGLGNDHSLAHQISSGQEIDRSSDNSSYHGLDGHQSKESDALGKDPSLGNSSTAAAFTTDTLPKTSISSLLQDKLGSNGHGINSPISSPYQESVYSATNIADSGVGVGQKFSAFSDMRDKNPVSPWASDYGYAAYNTDARSTANHAPASPPASGRKSRPSFLDSIQISKAPSSSPPSFGATKADSSSSKVYPMDSLGSYVSQRYANSSVASDEGIDQLNHVTENKPEFFSRKQNEDFAALEQHIEDLTQEKFSLQRALEASRALAESLASENSALTDSFNQQGSVVSQLKYDLERLQEEIKAQLVELEAVKLEYANVQLECNGADERAKLLASELIALEEKGLRLRSNELKLERELENSQAEISSYRKKISSLEKDRQDLQSTINALQEEKKLLQSKLRKASASAKAIDDRTSYSKKDVSTSTEDLDIKTITQSSDSENVGASSHGDDASSSQFAHEDLPLGVEGQPLIIPSEQIRMIENINTLIAELALEKDQLMQALSAESSRSSKLSELNKELTRKLEAQTQRLELLTAQSMANGNTQPRQPEARTGHDNMTYADEGDEVVERVLGWIMKLFPGGPSRRRTSKHL